ncbi:hypothetical protein KI688_004004 [Linnemannia hyalina]|uniref:C2H2-type domain-containing protein n=1 Tax=Linnemannia hyalina TaxID=64524 RepID=A0A9P7XMF2_9FUNG|nr:hypothetical protein KI688_004004 [Linnemannia hyalina]
MFPFTYTLGNQTPQQNTTTTTIHRESTDEVSKILTTLYDGESINSGNSNSSSSIDSIQAHFFFQHQQLIQHSDAPLFFHSTPTSMLNPAPWNMFTPTPVSPASPTSSCFSSSGNDTDTEWDSIYSSPAFALLPYPTNSAANTSIDAMKVELDEDSNLFLTIEDLLSNHVSAVDENAAVVGAASAGGNGDLYQYSAAGFTLLPEYLRVQEEDKKSHQHRRRHAKGKKALHISDNAGSHPYNNCNRTTGGPQRLSSRSPVISFAPYTSPTISCASLSLNQKQHNHNHNHNHNHLRQDDDDDAISTYSSSSSLSSAPSSRDSSPETFTTTTSSPETSTTTTTTSNGTETKTTSSDGTTRIINKDGSIMCFNRATLTTTFRCNLCPTQQQSFGRIHDLKRHQATKHATAEGGAPKVWPCEFCKNHFVRRDALLRHYTIKTVKDDGVHPGEEEEDVLAAARARAKLI